MSQKTTVTLHDDFDESTNGVRTVNFAVDGHAYEIDLSAKHLREFEKAMKPYVEHARKVRKTTAKTTAKAAAKVGPAKRHTSTVRASSAQPAAREVREWAATQGIEVPAKGRVPASVMEQFVGAASANE